MLQMPKMKLDDTLEDVLLKEADVIPLKAVQILSTVDERPVFLRVHRGTNGSFLCGSLLK